MSVTSWLFEKHPFFQELRRCVIRTIANRSMTSLDDVVVSSRRPVRTILLMLNRLLGDGLVRRTPAGLRAARESNGTADPADRASSYSSPARHLPNGFDLMATRYVEMVAQREAPVLLWSQRRLIPESAVDRCLYILNWMETARGRIAFLGDDDLVSPLLAAAAPGWNVEVIDIDKEVLATAVRTAEALGSHLETRHGDLSELEALGDASWDLVVSDPFPSRDASFEMLFWRHAARMLRTGGVSISTVAPSHKPIGFDSEALQGQRDLGLALVDLRAEHGRYESFEFEFTPFERSVLSRYQLSSRVAHTKSLMAACKVEAGPHGPNGAGERLDFGKWTAATLSHYLTVQAGVKEQQDLASARGPRNDAPIGAERPRRGLRVDVILPTHGRARAAERCAAPAVSERYWAEALSELDVQPSNDELAELARLTGSADIAPDGPMAELGLAIRAMESWERVRLDE